MLLYFKRIWEVTDVDVNYFLPYKWNKCALDLAVNGLNIRSYIRRTDLSHLRSFWVCLGVFL